MKAAEYSEEQLDRIRAKRLENVTPFKRQVYFALEDILRGNAWARFFGIALFFLIVGNAVLVFVLVQFRFAMTWAVGAFYGLSTLCFFTEYLFRLWIADLAFPQYGSLQSRLHYGLSGFGIIDLLAFLPNMIAWFFPISTVWMNIINVLRLMRLIKLSRYMRGLRTIMRVIKKSRSEIIAAFMVIGLLIVVSSILMYEVENPVQPEMFNSLFTGIYWAITTITTTGYGDIVPTTSLGRLLGSITMLLALGIIAVPSGIISAGFVAEYQSIQKRRSGDRQDEYFDDGSKERRLDAITHEVLQLAESKGSNAGLVVEPEEASRETADSADATHGNSSHTSTPPTNIS